MMSSKLVGKTVYIKPRRGDDEFNNEYRNAYGVISGYDGECYAIQLYCTEVNDTNNGLLFERKDFTVRRGD